MATKEVISNLYQKEFGRAPDAAGLAYWQDSGFTEAQLANSFDTSAEGVAYNTSIAAPATTTTAPNTTTPATDPNQRTNYINQLYKTELGRDSDQAGLDYWKDSNLTSDQLQASFNDSAEGVAWDASQAAPKVEDPPIVPTLDDVTPYVTPATPTFNLPKPDATTAPAYAAPATYVPDANALVSTQMDTLMDKNSSYLQQAGKAGERTAQARGLLNSSMAAGAAQGAAMDRALPIAQQDAQTFAAAGLAGYEGEINAALTSLQGKIQSDLSYQDTVQSDYINQRSLILQGLISSGLSTQEAEQNLQSFEYQNLLNTGLSDRQAQDKLDQIQVSAANALILDQKQQEGANYRTELERDLGLDKLAAADRDAVSTAMTNYGLQFQKDVTNIQLDTQTSGPEKTAKILTAQTVYENNMNNVAALYTVDLTWDTPFDASTNLAAPDTTGNTDTGTDTTDPNYDPTKNPGYDPSVASSYDTRDDPDHYDYRVYKGTSKRYGTPMYDYPNKSIFHQSP